MRRSPKDYRQISLKLEDLDGPIDLRSIFGRKGPVHIEIGSGKGTFLLNEAQASPQVNFLGIEWANRYYRYAVDRMGRWGLSNVRIIRTDAASFLAQFVPDASVDCFHIYFPDPWPKRRHHKRRFITAANIEQLLRTLKAGGQLRIATDHGEYFEQIRQVIWARGDGLEEIDFSPTAGADEGERVGTNFERKYLRQNRPVYTVAARKTQAPAGRRR